MFQIITDALNQKEYRNLRLRCFTGKNTVMLRCDYNKIAITN